MALPTRVVRRAPTATRRGEAYVTENTSSCSYVLGLTSATTPDYETLVSEISSHFNKGTFKTKMEAMEWLNIHMKS